MSEGTGTVTREAPKLETNGSSGNAGTPETGVPSGPADKPARRLPAGSRRTLAVVGAIVLIAVVIWLVRFFAYSTTHAQTDDAIVDADAITVTSKISERIAAIYVDTNQAVHKGQLLLALDSADERTKVAQAQSALDAQVAQARAAQANVALTRATVNAQSAQGAGGISSAQSGITNAQAGVAAAQKQLAASAAGVTTAQGQLQAAQAGVPAAREALNRAQADYARTASLVSSGDVARAQLDAARAALAGAQSQYQGAQDNVTAARGNVLAAQARVTASRAQVDQALAAVGSSQGQLATARGKLAEEDSPYRVSAQEASAGAAFAGVASYRAQLHQAQDQFSYTKIYAASDGYIGQKNVEVGQVVSPNQALFTIVPLNNVYITANYKETQIGAMRPGQPVDITVDAYKGTLFKGRVAALGPAANSKYALVPAQNATSNFVKVTQRVAVRITLDAGNDPNKPLRPGMSVETAVKIK